VTIGAHTVNHYNLSKLDPEALRTELTESRHLIAERLQTKVEHFTYPFGDAGSAGPREFALAKELGFLTATTTRKGLVFPEHVDHLQALPRVSLNGDYQRSRYVRLYLSGAPFALWKKFRRLDVT
jgi:peptidoglycan/xylan/chitin deacetylase (PgdA/CDA1 family)